MMLDGMIMPWVYFTFIDNYNVAFRRMLGMRARRRQVQNMGGRSCEATARVGSIGASEEGGVRCIRYARRAEKVEAVSSGQELTMH